MRTTDAHRELTRLRRVFADQTTQCRADGAPAAVTAALEAQSRLLDEAIQHLETSPAHSRELESLTTKELASKWRKSEWTIRDYAKGGRIPGARKIGRDWLFPLDPQLLPPTVIGVEASTEDLVAAIDAYLDRI